MQYYMLLQDGETFTELSGCCIVRTPEGLDPENIDLQDKKMFEVVAAFDHEGSDMTPTMTLKAPLLESGRATFPLEVTNYTIDNQQAGLYGQ